MRRRSTARRAAAMLLVGVATALLAVAAQASPADLDATFGGDGTVTTDFGDPAAAHALAYVSNGKLVAAGGAGDDFAVARYLPDGAPDGTLSGDGALTTDFGGQDEANGVVVQPNGKIVAAGVSDGDFALVRYKGGGKFDPSFGSHQGRVTTDFGGSDVARAVVRLPDGRFVAVGSSGQDFAVARYTFKGDLDSTFGTQGKVTTDFGGDDRADAVVLQSDGRLVVAGRSDGDFALARYDVNGTLDATFDGDGLVTTDFAGGDDAALGLALQGNGFVVAVGTTAQGGSSDVALARYRPDGSLDASTGPLDPGFGVDGRVTTDFGGAAELARGIAIQPDDSIVVAGGALSDFALARYEYDGDLELGFGLGGEITTDFGGADVAEAVALQSDGKIAVAGTTSAGDDFALARYAGDPALVPGTVPASPG